MKLRNQGCQLILGHYNCRYLIFGADRWIDPVTEIDNHYILRGTNIPVFFYDDITILDTVERGELINKIRKLL